MNSKRLSLTTATLLVVIFAFGASAAQADTFCANSSNPACQTNHTDLATAVQDAVDDAEQSNGADTVLIGPGNYFSPTPMGLYSTSLGEENSVTIIGSGPSTVLKVTDPENPTITFDAVDGSSMSDLKIEINASTSNGSKEGLIVRNSFNGDPPTINNISISSNPDAKNLAGVVLYSGSDIEDSSVDVSSTNYTVAVKADSGNPSVVSRSYLAANTGAVQNSTNGELILDRSEIVANGQGVKNSSGIVRISDSLIELSSGNAQRAIYAQASNTGPADTYIEGSTIVANAGSGIVVEANQGTSSAKLVMKDSVLAGAAGTASVSAANAGDSVTIETDRVAADSTKYSESGSGTVIGTLGLAVDLNLTSPGFANAGAGDYRLAAGSALIDAGRTEDPPPGALDYQGYPRACHGTDDGVIRRDIGAFEFKTDPLDDCTYPETTITDGPEAYPPAIYTGHSIWFDLASSKPGSTFRCSIDEAPLSACSANFTVDDLAYGEHTFKAVAVDQFGNIDQTPVSRNFALTVPKGGPPTCLLNPEICNPDKMAPKLTVAKVPKRTKKTWVKVKFGSDDPKAFYTCRLNKRPSVMCTSPWKTPKLKKGKNTIAIQAVDAAGNKSKIVKRVIKKLPKRK